MRKFLQVGGLIAGLVLIAFGIGAVYMGIDGRNQVRSDLAREQIVGTPDAGSVANKPINTGARAHAFAATMRKHTLEATKDQTYAQMGRFLDANGKPTNDATAAAKDPNGQPVENGLRNMWVTETALTTALNMAYFAEQVALFGIIVGIALILAGVGFVILALAGALKALPEKMPSVHRGGAAAPAAGD